MCFVCKYETLRKQYYNIKHCGYILFGISLPMRVNLTRMVLGSPFIGITNQFIVSNGHRQYFDRTKSLRYVCRVYLFIYLLVLFCFEENCHLQLLILLKTCKTLHYYKTHIKLIVMCFSLFVKINTYFGGYET